MCFPVRKNKCNSFLSTCSKIISLDKLKWTFLFWMRSSTKVKYFVFYFSIKEEQNWFALKIEMRWVNCYLLKKKKNVYIRVIKSRSSNNFWISVFYLIETIYQILSGRVSNNVPTAFCLFWFGFREKNAEKS